jgi:uncharacterized repeat protein (TIGR02543 family)
LTPKVRENKKVTELPAPMYMRIVRSDNTWEQWYSFDGENWTKNGEFSYAMQVKKVGIFAGNTPFEKNTPAHTAVVDYFFNTASPIDPEDSHYVLDVSIVGSGNVTANPDQAGYYCGQEVTLTATPSPGWQFTGWAGISGSNPVRKVTMTDDLAVTAIFQQGTVRLLYMPAIARP